MKTTVAALGFSLIGLSPAQASVWYIGYSCSQFACTTFSQCAVAAKSPAQWLEESEFGTRLIDLPDGGVKIAWGKGGFEVLYRDKDACLKAEDDQKHKLDKYR
jgi:hypothetical protein